jgi:DAACS family dicarboxylate/amino acid:cation (Na+ or H+) symporter
MGAAGMERGEPAGRRRIPLYARVLIGVALGAVLGVLFGENAYLGVKNEDLGALGMLVIRLLKALAVPLIFFAILDAFLRTRISASRGGKLVLICLMNVSVAFCLGLLILNLLQPGKHWQGQMTALTDALHLPAAAPASGPAPAAEGAPKPTLHPLKNFAGYVPESLVDPFTGKSNVITVVLLAVLGGAALRRVKDRQAAEGRDSIRTLERFVEAAYQVFVQMLEWVVLTIPFAVFGLVAQVVGRHGLEVFGILWIFLATMLLGLGIHALVYYPTMAWLVGRKSPREYLGKGADAIVTGLSCNSSLATVPVTLRCLERMKISPQSQRLAACVGTNLNNDGITLYEAMAALFLAQAIGYELGLGQQAVVVLASLMAGAGVAGIPEAGLIVLPLVLGAAGLPEAVIAAAIPLIVPVDWIIARARSGVNVMADMLVAILLDAGRKPGPEEEPAELSDDACETAEMVRATVGEAS